MVVTDAEYQLTDALLFKDFEMMLQQRFTAEAQQNLRWRFRDIGSEPGTGPGRQHDCFHLE